jgi:hypothetical protein
MAAFGAGEARCQPGDLVEVDVCGKLHLGDVHFQDFSAASAVRAVNQNLSVKPSGTQQCGIKHLWAIGRRDQDYARAGIKAIQLGEKGSPYPLPPVQYPGRVTPTSSLRRRSSPQSMAA